MDYKKHNMSADRKKREGNIIRAWASVYMHNISSFADGGKDRMRTGLNKYHVHMHA
jgi:hypothetical protein